MSRTLIAASLAFTLACSGTALAQIVNPTAGAMGDNTMNAPASGTMKSGKTTPDTTMPGTMSADHMKPHPAKRHPAKPHGDTMAPAGGSMGHSSMAPSATGGASQ